MALNILMVTSEAYPLAKTGGLGDAVSGLAQAVSADDTPVTILMPAWPGAAEKLDALREVAWLHDLPGGPASLLEGVCPALGGLRVLLLRNDALYHRPGLYVDENGEEYVDNAVRFAALSRAAVHVVCGVGSLSRRPSLVHAHDWHAALTPLYMRQAGITDVKSMLTLHNVAFQGVYPLHLAPELGIDPRYCSADGMEFWGQLNFLKAGIRFADLLTVVSRNYAREILTPAYGCGLEGALADRGEHLVAIPNGIDTGLWNPAKDAFLGGISFAADNLRNKRRCKQRLQQLYGLPAQAQGFLLAMGSRLTGQKMADVAARALPLALDRHPQLQLCVMGEGDKAAEQALRAVAERYPQRCGVYIGYSEERAHMLHAGADALLHGSRFEPFGLTPLYAMRYGTIPIGSRVGGMVDTIVDPGSLSDSQEAARSTGILFDGDTPEDMLHAIDRAIGLSSSPVVWRRMQRNGMTADMGWSRAAPQYIHSYQALRPDVLLGRVPERARAPLRARAPSGQALARAALGGALDPVRYPDRGTGVSTPSAAATSAAPA